MIQDSFHGALRDVLLASVRDELLFLVNNERYHREFVWLLA